MSNIPDSARVALVAAAAASAGPPSAPGWAERVSDAALELFVLTDPGSALSKRLDDVAGSKKYVATVLGVSRKRDRSGNEIDKGLVRLQGKPSVYHADGIEEIQTDWLNTPSGSAVFDKAQGLVGHRVLVYTVTESFIRNDGVAAKSKTLVHLTDLGEDRFAGNQSAPGTQSAPRQAQAPQAQPQTSVWDEPPFDEPPF